jgi:pyrroloquinoline quinone (PQQ) biosynthesis protein C
MEQAMQFYDQLLVDTDTSRKYLLDAPIIQQALAGDFSLATYIAFLNQAYHHVRHTVPLLESACANLRDDQAWMGEVLSEYIAEETGHEQWILNDIEACGYERTEYESGPAPLTSEIMIAYLYDYINRINPVGLFGMVLVLEGISSDLAPAVARIVQRELQLPDSAVTYLISHGELDQSHIRFFENAMNRITSKDDQQAITHAANVVYRLYGDVYRSLPRAAAQLSHSESDTPGNAAVAGAGFA